ncbi:hypothetical protein [Entomohabitans teleogrylli]|uniref:hypothetical protein n=1 Tax=Entomohabitans teleogrylli TaxID=1384589 RepID=UPI00073D403B|nr:hypothetical protein [Entomohabitans teleogrylli]
MATVRYPDWLPLPQRADQNFTQDTGFQTIQPAIGPAIFIPQTTDLKGKWSLKWIFTLEQAERFKSWLRSPNYCDRGNAWFTIPIDLGDTQGVQDQEVHFTSMPVQTSKNGITVTWTATVICNEITDITEYYDDWIVEAPQGYGYWLDYLVTAVMPEAK